MELIIPGGDFGRRRLQCEARIQIQGRRLHRSPRATRCGTLQGFWRDDRRTARGSTTWEPAPACISANRSSCRLTPTNWPLTAPELIRRIQPLIRRDDYESEERQDDAVGSDHNVLGPLGDTIWDIAGNSHASRRGPFSERYRPQFTNPCRAESWSCSVNLLCRMLCSTKSRAAIRLQRSPSVTERLSPAFSRTIQAPIPATPGRR